MKKAIIKGAVIGAAFFTALFLISAVMNKGNTDMTTEMGPASFPLLSMKVEGTEVNCLHGYSNVMKPNYLRDTITPLGEGRKVSLVVRRYGRNIDNIRFEVRSMDGERLIEDTPVTDYTMDGDTIEAEFALKDLIESNQEYTLVILVETEGITVRYYTRVIEAEDYHTREKLDYIRDFHEKTFRKEAAKEDLSKYLESNAEGDNSSYGKVTIHSSFHQVTWGELAVEQVTEPEISVKELSPQTGSFEMRYVAAVQGEAGKFYANVKEFYRVRYTPDRMYLLDYERSMNQIFDEKQDLYSGDAIMLGISDKEIPVVESDGGNVFAFVNEDRLFSVNVSDQKLAVLFGFYDERHTDARDRYSNHEIEILNVDETGNVQFMVYGYMNRGRHEGSVGIAVYNYSSLTNTVEEQLYIPYDKSYELLKNNVEQLVYLNKTNVFCVMLDGTVYAMDLNQRTGEALVENLLEGSYQVSESGRMMVWQEENDLYSSSRLLLINLNTWEKTEIEAGGDEYIAPLGFIGEDLVYGLAKKNDITTDIAGTVTFPMYCVKIQNEENKILKSYQENGIYTLSSSIEDNQIILHQVTREEESGALIEAKDAQIVNTKVVPEGYNTIDKVVTEKYETLQEIRMKTAIDEKLLKVLTPKEVLFEGERELTAQAHTPADAETTGNARESENGKYYVYGKNGVEGVFRNPAKAVSSAYESAGVVVDQEGGYIWTRGNRSLKNQIMAIQGQQITEEKNSLSVCLDEILKLNGMTRNTKYMLESGKSAIEILQESLEDAQILDLTGCGLDAVLYYVNKDFPVLAMLNDGNAVLIIGFNELNTVIMDPITGIPYKKGMNDSKTWFEENGNRFITYVKEEN